MKKNILIIVSAIILILSSSSVFADVDTERLGNVVGKASFDYYLIDGKGVMAMTIYFQCGFTISYSDGSPMYIWYYGQDEGGGVPDNYGIIGEKKDNKSNMLEVDIVYEGNLEVMTADDSTVEIFELSTGNSIVKNTVIRKNNKLVVNNIKNNRMYVIGVKNSDGVYQQQTFFVNDNQLFIGGQ